MTVPLLAPVLTVVFITMLIYVLKVFDIVICGRARVRRRTTRTSSRSRCGGRRSAGVRRLRPRLGDRGLPLPARHPHPRVEHPALPEGGVAVASVAAEVEGPVVVEEGIAIEDRPLPREDPGLRHHRRSRPALARPDVRASCSRRSSPRRRSGPPGGGRRSPRRARSRSRTTATSSGTTRSRARSGRRSGYRWAARSSRSWSRRSPAMRSPGSSFPGATGGSSSSSRYSSFPSRWR